MSKVILFWALFWQILLDVRKHYNLGISARKKNKSITILICYYLVQVRVNIWSKLGVPKNSQLGPDNNHFLRTISKVETPIVYSVFDKQCSKTNLDQIITIKNANLDQMITPQHAYIYIYIHIYAAGCLKEPQILTPCARNMRKRSAKCVFFLKKSTQFWLPRFGVLLSTHDFVPIFFFFFSPFSRGVRGFCSGVGAQSSAKHRGESVWRFFPLQTRGAAR